MNFFFVVLLVAILEIFFSDRFTIPFVAKFCKKCMDVPIVFFKKIQLQSDRAKKIAEIVFACVICLISFGTTWILLFYASKLHIAFSFGLEIICAVQLINVRSFARFILKNRGKYSANDLIVTITIHFTNYCIAPLLYVALGGIPLAVMCRAIHYCAKTAFASGQNIQDNQSGQGGQFFVKADNVLHFVPSYVFVLAVLGVSAVLPFCNPGHGWYIFVRDRKKFTPHWKSRIIAICAGILGIQLAFINNTIAEKSLIGDALYSLSSEHIKMTLYLMYASTAVVLCLCLIFAAAFGLMIL